jgi:hypothetical protein
MTVDIDKIKALALAAKKGSSTIEKIESMHAFWSAVDPATVLELIAEVERLRADAARWKAWKQWWMHSETEHAQLPPEVEELMDSLDLDEAMDAHIGAHNHAGREPA